MEEKMKKKPKSSSSSSSSSSDRLSPLHDYLLHHILSFLPTHHSVRTCVLSQRWRHLWKSVPLLDLLLDSRRDALLATHVLDRRSPLAPTAAIRLRVDSNCPDSAHELDACVRYAIQHGAADVDIQLWCGWSMHAALLDDILSHRPLERLKLDVTFDDPVELPSRVRLGRLRVLELDFVAKVAGPSLTRLVSNCPSLEALSLVGEFEEIEVRSRSLRKLKLDVVGTEKVSVSCPVLEHFVYEVDDAVKDFRGRMPSLVKAEVFTEGNVALKPAVICQIYRGLQNASDVYSELCVVHPLEEPYRRLPMFPNLRNLSICACLHDNNVQALICLLRNSPNLELLEISDEPTCRCVDQEQDRTWRDLIDKFLNDLRKVWSGFSKRETLQKTKFLKIIN